MIAQYDKLRDLIEDFDVAMLVTAAPDGELRSRPMALADIDAGGDVWFFTQRHSGKVDDIAADANVNVALQSTTKFVSLSGRAVPVDDRAKVEELWRDTWKHWFPKGKNDPDLLLLKVDARTGEYWDNSGMSGIKYLFEAGKALVTGTKPDVANDPDIHGKVRL